MKQSFARRLRGLFLPFWDDVRTYGPGKARADLMAGITVAIVASPQSMAYAMIAGVDPIYGLYASIFPVIVAALWGSSRYLLAGPTNALSMLLYSSMAQLTLAGVAVATLPEDQRLAYIFFIALLAGLMQLGMGLAHIGDLANFISHSVIVAFTTGASLLIALGQMRNFFGLHFVAPPDTGSLVVQTFAHLPQTNIYSMLIGVITLGSALLIKKFFPRWPNALLSLVIAAFAAAMLDLEARGVAMCAAIPRGLPPLSIPGPAQWSHIQELLLPSLAIALLASVETLAIARSMANQRGDNLDSNQELIGQGLGNIAAGFTSAIPGCGSFSRSAVNFTSGAQTRFSALLSGLLTFAAIVALGPLVRYIAVPSLAALLILICYNMIKVDDIKFTLSATPGDRLVFIVTLLCVLVLDLDKAVFTGVLLSLVLFLRRQARPVVGPLDRCMIPGPEDHWLYTCPGLAIYRIEGPLFFGAVSELENNLAAFPSGSYRVLLLQLNRVNMVDATGAHALKGFIKRWKERGLTLIIASSSPDVLETLARTKVLPEQQLCSTMQKAFALAMEIFNTPEVDKQP